MLHGMDGYNTWDNDEAMYCFLKLNVVISQFSFNYLIKIGRILKTRHFFAISPCIEEAVQIAIYMYSRIQESNFNVIARIVQK